MKKFAIVNYHFYGPIDWENEFTICVNESNWYKPRVNVQRINFLQYKILRFARWINNKIVKADK